ncbi:uncharacterized protein METZ01_LOCUS169993, partial [marine metagenome]
MVLPDWARVLDNKLSNNWPCAFGTPQHLSIKMKMGLIRA